ncbi:uncharacterized protein (DUF58 family) [Alkalibacillus filiformis]|uniref:Uncharacterized protein (DUF58 family) n=1 Tax=Alkalibacillus filiformis TaxID=200990 RepID=A0ABU0DTP7_9BACI|nr:DUF58 domain-containing protein [Alkalibacillus filiformis]MDQ0351842.1 uncharacterized protein (DUF58 family) [Alkalibacillus filiformis]
MANSLKFVLKLILVLALTITLFVYGMFQGGFVSWFLFFSFLPILAYSIMMIFYPLKFVKVERQVSKHYLQAGQTLNVTVNIKRVLPLPIFYLVVEDGVPEMLTWHDTRHHKYRFLSNPNKLKSRQNSKTIVFPFLRRKMSYQYNLESIPRGRHEFGQVKLLTGDVMGLVKKERTYDVETAVLVEPGEVSLQLELDRSTFEEGQQSAYTITANHTNLVSGVRDYAPGDQLSWIDWKTTARKQELVTKEFEEEKHKDLSIILNGSSQDFNLWLAFEAAVEVTHAVANHSYEDHGNVSVIALGHAREEVVLSHGKQSLEKLTRLLSQIQLVQGDHFPQQLKREAWQLSKDRYLVVVTHELSPAINKTIIQLKQQQVDVHIIFIRSKQLISHEERVGMDQLHYSGVKVTWLNEDRLARRHIEVNA